MDQKETKKTNEKEDNKTSQINQEIFRQPIKKSHRKKRSTEGIVLDLSGSVKMSTQCGKTSPVIMSQQCGVKPKNETIFLNQSDNVTTHKIANRKIKGVNKK